MSRSNNIIMQSSGVCLVTIFVTPCIDAGVSAPILTLLVVVAAVMFVVCLYTPISSEFYHQN